VYRLTSSISSKISVGIITTIPLVIRERVIGQSLFSWISLQLDIQAQPTAVTSHVEAVSLVSRLRPQVSGLLELLWCHAEELTEPLKAIVLTVSEHLVTVLVLDGAIVRIGTTFP
jgi:hypothetical protein